MSEQFIHNLVKKVVQEMNASPQNDTLQHIVQAGASRVGTQLGGGAVETPLNEMIDHTLLKAESTQDDILKICEEAQKYRFCSVCINPFWVPLAARELRGSSVKVCTVIGFPLGANSTETKMREARLAITHGAQELDMVLNIGALRSKQYQVVEDDIRAVVQSARSGILVKVILETCYLTDEEKILACEIAKRAGADFVKTSTGFGSGGAKASDIALMRMIVGPEMGVKASGGIRDLQIAETMIRAGANRLGASASVSIVSKCGGIRATSGY
jgi:deoxyribose-phosphate aldolase